MKRISKGLAALTCKVTLTLFLVACASPKDKPVNEYPVAKHFGPDVRAQICAQAQVTGVFCDQAFITQLEQALIDYYKPSMTSQAWKFCDKLPSNCLDPYQAEDYFKQYSNP